MITESNNKTRDKKGKSSISNVNDYTIIDIETTGLNPRNDKIIELSAIKVRNNRIVDNFSTLINPNIKVSSYITNLTNITNKMLCEAPTIEEKINEFLNFIGNDVILGHNVNFDINFIYDNSMRILNKPFSNNYVDTLRVSRKYTKDVNNHKLGTLAKKYNINYEKAHRALDDCFITYQLYNKLKNIIKSSKNVSNEFEINTRDDNKKIEFVIDNNCINKSEEREMQALIEEKTLNIKNSRLSRSEILKRRKSIDKKYRTHYFDNEAYCCHCKKNLGLFTLRSRLQLIDGWICLKCFKKILNLSEFKRKAYTVNNINEMFESLREEVNR